MTGTNTTITSRGAEVGRGVLSEDQRARVLVVDDDSDLAEAYRHVLELAGYDVATALSGEAALASARDTRPEVVVTDISMPEMDGFELIQRLQALLEGDRPPVVVCSAFDVTEREALARGAQLFLKKPASADTLIHSIEALRQGHEPDDAALEAERAHVQHERLSNLRDSAVRIAEIDRAEVAREAQPWLEWLRVYFDSGSAGMFFLDGAAVRPAVAVGPHLAKRGEPRLLNATLAAGITTGTSLVIGDMVTHPAFRQVLGPRSEIASFVGVPLETTDRIRVGALCLADGRADRFDADSLIILELLGRGGVWAFFEKGVATSREARRSAPLLQRRMFAMLLEKELRLARRAQQAIELCVATLAPGTSPLACAEDLWRAGARERLAIGGMGPGRIAWFVRAGAKEARDHLAASLKHARAHGLVNAAGVAGVLPATKLSQEALIELAEGALSVAEATKMGPRPRVERIVVRTDSGRYFA